MGVIRLTGEEWEEIEPLVPKQKRGRPRNRNKECFEAILYVLKTGCQWGFLPGEYPPKSTVHRRFLLWHKMGFFRKLFKKTRRKCLKDALVHVDATLRVAKRGPLGKQGWQIQVHENNRHL
jgi:transposase